MEQELVNEIDLDNLTNKTPEEIAEILFTHEAKDPFSHQIVAETDVADALYIFEILLTILVKGIEILSGDLSKVELDTITENHILGLNPWFHSLGFSVQVDTLNKNEDLEFYKDYYCRILIKDSVHQNFFEQRHYKNNYHFLVNGTSLEENEKQQYLNDLYAIFTTGNHTVFKIGFEFYTPIASINTKLL